MAPTSASSQGSAGWISRWKRRGLPASAKSSGTPTAPASSSDGGRLFPVGEMSPRSALLPTPDTMNARDGANHRAEEKGHHALSLHHWADRTSSSAASPASQPPPQDADAAPPTIAGSGPSSPVSLASWDPATSSWRTFQGSLLSTEDERFPRSWERWPTSGTTRRGVASALPTSALPTDGSGCSYLPTPAAQMAKHGAPTPAELEDREDRARWGDLHVLLHTPTTGDTAPTYDHRASPGYTRTKPVPNLAAQIEDELLPTPRAAMRKVQDRGEEYRVNLEEAIGALDSLGDLTEERSTDGSEP